MPLVLDLLCKYCAADNCDAHLETIVVFDKVTGLEIEARCNCKTCALNKLTLHR